ELENNKSIELLHHECSGGQASVGDDINVNTHYIILMEHNGEIIELDGRKNEPISHGQRTSSEFIYDVAKIIQNVFIEKCKGDNRISALAVVPIDSN
ncbi:ubiquitin carboxyl-terminal hydrolase isozyme L3, partial [Hepatocystis sp. ex Piliocolobus tephrosceles]